MINREVIKYIRALFIWGLLIFVFLITGCASTPEAPVQIQGVFYPPPPELPRIQYLRSFTSNKDVETAVSKFDKFVTGQEEKIKRLDKPYGVGIYNGRIYVCDTNLSIMVFDLENKKFHTLEGAKGLGKSIQPLNISIDDDGTKYVVDPVRGQVLVYDSKDFFVKAFGSQIEWTPIDVDIFNDRLYVIDRNSAEVWVLDKDSGELVDKIGKKSEKITEQLFKPTNLIFNSDGNLYIADAGRFQLVRYDRDGHFLGTIGILGTSPGRFSRPKGLATDRKGRVYAVDAAFDNVQIFNRDGRFLMSFGEPGNSAGDLNLPAKVIVDYDNIQYFSEYIDPNFEAEAIIIVTSQFGPRLVNVYALGRQKGVDYPADEELLQQLEKRKKELEEKENKEKKEEK